MKTNHYFMLCKDCFINSCSAGPVGARGKNPSNKMMIDFGPNGSKSPGNGKILITKCAKCLVSPFFAPIFDLYPNYRGKWAKLSF